MNAASMTGINATSFLSQLRAISQRLCVETMPCAMTGQGLVFARFDPKNPIAQNRLDPLIQTGEAITRDEFVKQLPFDASPSSGHPIAREWLAMQSIVDGARAEARLLADIACGDREQRSMAAASIKAHLAPPASGLSVVSLDDALGGYRTAFMASLRTAMLLDYLLGESHAEVAARFFQAAVNLLQMERPTASAMFAEIAAERLSDSHGSSPVARGRAWYSTFAAKAWLKSRDAGDQPEVARFRIDRGLYNGWLDESHNLMFELFDASEKLNLSLGLHAEATADMLRAAFLMLERGKSAFGEAEAFIRASILIGRAAESASKAPGIKGSADILRDLHRRTAEIATQS